LKHPPSLVKAPVIFYFYIFLLKVHIVVSSVEAALITRALVDSYLVLALVTPDA
jgi:hypothetical protein